MALCRKDTEVASRAMSRANVPRWQAHLWSTGYSARSLLNPVSTAPRGWKGGGGDGLVEHAVGS